MRTCLNAMFMELSASRDKVKPQERVTNVYMYSY